jgi:hypothetical protein
MLIYIPLDTQTIRTKERQNGQKLKRKSGKYFWQFAPFDESRPPLAAASKLAVKSDDQRRKLGPSDDLGQLCKRPCF